MTERADSSIYQLHIWIRQLSPMIRRWVLVRSDSTLAQLYDVIQILFDWSDAHLHRFRIHGRDYGISRVGGIGFSHEARTVWLGDFQFRRHEQFLGEYDLGDSWQHEVRIERGLPEEPKRTYPICVCGRRKAPPEDCGGPWAFLERRDAVPFDVSEHLERLVESVEAGDRDAIRDQLEDIESLRDWLNLDRFDRRHVNRRLRQYAAGDEDWRWT
jgi:Plasmid pRiA4b ORF-3-like protein